MRTNRTSNFLVRLLLAALLIAGCLLVPPALADNAAEGYREMVPGIFEHVTDFLVTLDLALFALVGYFAKDGLGAEGRARVFEFAALGFFVAANVLSLFFAYWARLEIATQLAGGAFSYAPLTDYVWQARLLFAGAISAVLFIGRALLRKREKPPR